MLVQVTSSICASLPENKSLCNIEHCPVCRLSDTAHSALHSCRNSDFYAEISVLPGSDPKEHSLPHLKPLPLTVAFRLGLHAYTPDRFPTWISIWNLPSLFPFLPLGLEALFPLFVGTQQPSSSQPSRSLIPSTF